MRSGINDAEMLTRSLYMRLVRSRLEDDVCYPARHCDPEIINELIDLGHAVEVDDIGYRITNDGIQHYADMVSDQLLYAPSRMYHGQPGFLRSYILEDEKMELRNAHIKTLKKLHDAGRRLPERELNIWGLQQLVKWRLVEKYGDGSYAITQAGWEILDDQPSGEPIDPPILVQLAPTAPVVQKPDDCEDCTDCIYKDVYDLLVERLPVIEQAKEYAERQREMKRKLQALLDGLAG